MVRTLDSFLDEWRSPSPTVTVHTSGSTGKPKEIQLTKEAMRRSAQATNSFFGIGRDSVLVCPLSVGYIAGKMMVVRALEAGARLVMCSPSRHGFLSDLPDDVGQIDLLPIVPAQIDALMASPHAASVRNVIVGGAPMTPAQEETLRRAPFRAWATYGMTETCSHVALRDVTAAEELFTALPHVSLSVDPRGCLVIDGSLVTNDVVELQPDGRRFRWLGRADNVINTGGVKIHPEEMEARLRPVMPEGLDFYLTSRPSAEWGREVVMIVLSPLDALSTVRVMGACRRVLPREAVPKAIVYDAAPEYTASGKLIRRR